MIEIHHKGNIPPEMESVIHETPQSIERFRDEYENFLGFDTEDLRGESVLNIGCSLRGGFDKEMAAIGADVHSMSPFFASEVGQEQAAIHFAESTMGRWMRQIFKKGKWPKLVAAVAEDLPFEDATFDRILALYSVPLYSAAEKHPTVMSEIVRTLKDDGQAHLYPVSAKDLPGILEALNQLPVLVKHEAINESSDQVYRGKIPYRLTIKKIAS